MRRMVGAGFATAVFLAAAAAAQQPPAVQPRTDESQAGRPQPGPADAGNYGASTRGASTEAAQGVARQPGSDALAGAIHSDDLLGATVRNTADENIGTVDALLIGKDARVVGVVIEVGGFLGVGARQVVVPMTQLGMIDDDNVRLQGATREQLETAPVYERRGPQGG